MDRQIRQTVAVAERYSLLPFRSKHYVLGRLMTGSVLQTITLSSPAGRCKMAIIKWTQVGAVTTFQQIVAPVLL